MVESRRRTRVVSRASSLSRSHRRSRQQEEGKEGEAALLLSEEAKWFFVTGSRSVVLLVVDCIVIIVSAAQTKHIVTGRHGSCSVIRRRGPLLGPRSSKTRAHAQTTVASKPKQIKTKTQHMWRGGRRHKGRIERLRVRLAYGFEARTQHQLSSSWHKGGGGRTTECKAKKQARKGQQSHTHNTPPVSSTTSQVAPPHRLSAVRCLISRHNNAARSALQRWSSPRRQTAECKSKKQNNKQNTRRQ